MVDAKFNGVLGAPREGNHLITTDHPFFRHIGMSSFTSGDLYAFLHMGQTTLGKWGVIKPGVPAGGEDGTEGTCDNSSHKDREACEGAEGIWTPKPEVPAVYGHVKDLNQVFSAIIDGEHPGRGGTEGEADVSPNGSPSGLRTSAYFFGDVRDYKDVPIADQYAPYGEGNDDFFLQSDSIRSKIAPVLPTNAYKVIYLNEAAVKGQLETSYLDASAEVEEGEEFPPLMINDNRLQLATGLLNDIKSSQSGCMSWVSMISFDFGDGCVEIHPVKFNAYLYGKTYPWGHKSFHQKGAPKMAIIPKTGYGRRFTTDDGAQRQLGKLGSVAEGGEENAKNLVSSELDVSYNPNTGKVEAGNKQIMARLLTNLAAAEVNPLPPDVHAATEEDFFDYRSPYYTGNWCYGEAMPLTLSNGNPNTLGPVWNRGDCDEDDRKDTIVVVNRSTREFLRGELVLCTYIDGEWVIQDFGEPASLANFGVQQWQFWNLISDSSSYFRDGRHYDGIPLEGLGAAALNKAEHKIITPTNYETTFRQVYYAKDSWDNHIVNTAGAHGYDSYWSNGYVKWLTYWVNHDPAEYNVGSNKTIATKVNTFGSKRYWQLTGFDFVDETMMGIGGISAGNASVNPTKAASCTGPTTVCLMPDGSCARDADGNTISDGNCASHTLPGNCEGAEDGGVGSNGELYGPGFCKCPPGGPTPPRQNITLNDGTVLEGILSYGEDFENQTAPDASCINSSTREDCVAPGRRRHQYTDSQGEWCANYSHDDSGGSCVWEKANTQARCEDTYPDGADGTWTDGANAGATVQPVTTEAHCICAGGVWNAGNTGTEGHFGNLLGQTNPDVNLEGGGALTANTQGMDLYPFFGAVFPHGYSAGQVKLLKASGTTAQYGSMGGWNASRRHHFLNNEYDAKIEGKTGITGGKVLRHGGGMFSDPGDGAWSQIPADIALNASPSGKNGGPIEDLQLLMDLTNVEKNRNFPQVDFINRVATYFDTIEIESGIAKGQQYQRRHIWAYDKSGKGAGFGVGGNGPLMSATTDAFSSLYDLKPRNPAIVSFVPLSAEFCYSYNQFYGWTFTGTTVAMENQHKAWIASRTQHPLHWQTGKKNYESVDYLMNHLLTHKVFKRNRWEDGNTAWGNTYIGDFCGAGAAGSFRPDADMSIGRPWQKMVGSGHWAHNMFTDITTWSNDGMPEKNPMAMNDAALNSYWGRCQNQLPSSLGTHGQAGALPPGLINGIPFGPFVKHNSKAKVPTRFWELEGGGNAVGIICARAKIRMKNYELVLKTANKFGLGRTAAGTDRTTWGTSSSNEKIYGFGTTNMFAKLYDQWPDEQTLFDPRYFAVMHFNPGYAGENVSTEVIPSHSGFSTTLNGWTSLYRDVAKYSTDVYVPTWGSGKGFDKFSAYDPVGGEVVSWKSEKGDASSIGNFEGDEVNLGTTITKETQLREPVNSAIDATRRGMLLPFTSFPKTVGLDPSYMWIGDAGIDYSVGDLLEFNGTGSGCVVQVTHVGAAGEVKKFVLHNTVNVGGVGDGLTGGNPVGEEAPNPLEDNDAEENRRQQLAANVTVGKVVQQKIPGLGYNYRPEDFMDMKWSDRNSPTTQGGECSVEGGICTGHNPTLHPTTKEECEADFGTWEEASSSKGVCEQLGGTWSQYNPTIQISDLAEVPKVRTENKTVAKETAFGCVIYAPYGKVCLFTADDSGPELRGGMQRATPYSAEGNKGVITTPHNITFSLESPSPTDHYDLFVHFHNDISHTILSNIDATNGMGGGAQFVKLELTVQ